ncbi:CASPA protein, partial [Centropus unirufus]|nr:CASPA protein [Centropus unirufus]
LHSGRETVGSGNMEHDVYLKFRQQLLLIDQNLVSEDVSALKFLCTDLLPFKKLENVKSALDIFQLLIDEDYLSKEDTFLLAELLYRIKRYPLLKILGYTKEEVEESLQEKGKVSPYRQMLYELAENISDENLKDIIFLLQDCLPKRRSLSALELLILMEKQGLLSENNVQMLEKVCMRVSSDLLERVQHYKRTKVCNFSSFNVLWSDCKHIGGKNLHSLMLEASGHYCLPHRYTGAHTASSCVTGAEGSPCLYFETLLAVRCFFTGSCLKMMSYKMDGPHRGFCLVINNVKFRGSLQKREGSYKDAEELQRVFTWLGLEVVIRTNQTSEDIEKLMLQWQSLPDHKDRDCFICCILSHGESGAIYGEDEELVSIRKIMSYFTATNCPLLAEKPKLFFIQACQGGAIQRPVYLKAEARTPALSSMKPSLSLSEGILEEPDFLLGMATIDGFASFRHATQGTWYIQALCSKLQLLVPRGGDILTILTEVNADVSRRAGCFGTKKQMPQPASTLRRKFVFPVPTDPPPS